MFIFQYKNSQKYSPAAHHWLLPRLFHQNDTGPGEYRLPADPRKDLHLNLPAPTHDTTTPS